MKLVTVQIAVNADCDEEATAVVDAILHSQHRKSIQDSKSIGHTVVHSTDLDADADDIEEFGLDFIGQSDRIINFIAEVLGEEKAERYRNNIPKGGKFMVSNTADWEDRGELHITWPEGVDFETAFYLAVRENWHCLSNWETEDRRWASIDHAFNGSLQYDCARAEPISKMKSWHKSIEDEKRENDNIIKIMTDSKASPLDPESVLDVIMEDESEDVAEMRRNRSALGF